MDIKNQRRERRLKADELPEELRSFTVLLAAGMEQLARTVDASPGGFGFVAGGDPDLYIVGSRITMYPFGTDTPLHGRIVHVAETFDGYRVGVAMLETARYEAWKTKIHEIMHNAPTLPDQPGPGDLVLGED